MDRYNHFIILSSIIILYYSVKKAEAAWRINLNLICIYGVRLNTITGIIYLSFYSVQFVLVCYIFIIYTKKN